MRVVWSPIAVCRALSGQGRVCVVRSDASVVTMYLSEHGNKKMKQVLSRYLKPGARVVTYQFPVLPCPHTHDPPSQ